MRLLVALAMAAAAVMTWSAPATPVAGARPSLQTEGADLYADGCQDCHGADLRGLDERGPSLIGVGAAAVDFYVGTGRMPLARPGIEPVRTPPQYSRAERAALIAYITSKAPGAGPEVPQVSVLQGDLAQGRELFMDNCSGCHQAVGQGGIAPGLIAPPLGNATPTQIGEAIRVGPYLMPRFSPERLDETQVASIARYVTQVAAEPPDRGGWGIGNIGPIPEGLVAFLLAGGALLLVARLIGERT